MSILSLERIQLNSSAATKEEAIQQAGELLANSGCIQPDYIAGMFAREETMSTYLGNGVAIPHGMHESVQYIKQSAISVVQIRAGVDWEDGEKAHIVIGIAALGDDHMVILSNLAEVIEEMDAVMALATTDEAQFILDQLTAESVN
jgi:PTS system mannitol-specific IIA component